MTAEDFEIKARLHDLADSAGPWDDPLPGALERAREETPVDLLRHPRRPTYSPWMLSAAAAVVLISGTAVGVRMLDHRTTTRNVAIGVGRPTVSTVVPAAGTGCGKPFMPAEPARNIGATVTVRAPRQFTWGTPLHANVQVAAGSFNGTLSARFVILLADPSNPSWGLEVGQVVTAPAALIVSPDATASFDAVGPAIPTCPHDKPSPGTYRLIAEVTGHEFDTYDGPIPAPITMVSQPVNLTAR